MSRSDTDWVEARAVTIRSSAFYAMRSCVERCVQRWTDVHKKYDNLPTCGSFEFIQPGWKARFGVQGKRHFS